MQNFIILLVLSFLVGLSGAIYFRIFKRVYAQEEGKVVAGGYGRIDAYLALACISIFAIQSVQNFHASERAIPRNLDTGLLVLVQLVFWLFIVGMILFSLVLRRMYPSELFGLDRLDFGKVVLWGSGLLLVALPMIFASSALISSVLHLNSQTDSQPIVQMFEGINDPTKKIPIILLAVVIAPLAEEFVFRGFLYGVAKRFAGPLPALVFTAVVFALVHLHVPSLLPLFLLACVLTFAYELTGSLLVPMAMHSLFNSITLVGVFFVGK